MADRVHPNDLAVLGQLHRPGDDRHVDRLPRPASTGGVRRAGEADHTATVGEASHRQPDSRVPGAALNRHPRDPVGLVRLEPLRVRGDQHTRVQDLHQAVADHDLDRLTGERRADDVVEPGE